jgi:predicted nucleic acid-binding protein
MILDTNAVSNFADANQRLLHCLQQSAADIHLPVIVLGEYPYGVKSSRLRAARESWLDELDEPFSLRRFENSRNVVVPLNLTLNL